MVAWRTVGAGPAVAMLFVLQSCSRSTPEVPPPTVTHSLAIVRRPGSQDSLTRRIGEDVSRRLRAIPGLRVVTTPAPVRVDLRTTARLLNVAAVLELRSSDSTQPTLIATVGDEHDTALISRTFALGRGAIPDIEDRIVVDVANELRAHVGLPKLRDPAHDTVAGRAREYLERADAARRARDFDGADRAYIAAVRADPQLPDARLRYAQFLSARGRLGEATREARRAHELDPLSPAAESVYVTTLRRSGRGQDAERELAETKRIRDILENAKRTPPFIRPARPRRK